VNVYVRLTEEFNRGRVRAMISSGQAVVLHNLAIMSKDGDWILREDEEVASHVRNVLSAHGATYRFGAPLDPRWLSGGWSSHFEYRDGMNRIRADFVSRPPRLSEAELALAWRDAELCAPPVIGLRELAELKKTNREKDYAVIGELARHLPSAYDQLLLSRSARDLQRLAETHPDDWARACAKRPLLQAVSAGTDALEVALDAERRELMHANERRLQRYLAAAGEWGVVWPEVERMVTGVPLERAHVLIVEQALRVLPFSP
jgi:hypothetical protein